MAVASAVSRPYVDHLHFRQVTISAQYHSVFLQAGCFSDAQLAVLNALKAILISLIKDIFDQRYTLI